MTLLPAARVDLALRCEGGTCPLVVARGTIERDGGKCEISYALAADGRLTLAGLPEGDSELRIGLETERPTVYRTRLVSELSATVNIATLGGAHVLSGRVLSPDGSPAVGAITEHEGDARVRERPAPQQLCRRLDGRIRVPRRGRGALHDLRRAPHVAVSADRGVAREDVGAHADSGRDSPVSPPVIIGLDPSGSPCSVRLALPVKSWRCATPCRGALRASTRLDVCVLGGVASETLLLFPGVELGAPLEVEQPGRGP